MQNILYQNVEGQETAYAVFGNEPVDLVIEMGLGTCMGEWQHIAQRLSETHTVLLYERQGCGSSQMSKAARTPANIARELYGLLERIPHKEQITILAHSQGGLYAQQFARLYPEAVKKLVLLDPLSASDNRFKRELSKKEYEKSGVDKRRGLRLNLMLARLGLGSAIKKFMKNAPPFYYYKDFSPEAAEYILSCLTQPKVYRAALEEYEMSHRDDIISELKSKAGFPQIPIRLVTHSSQMAVKEIMEFGGLHDNEGEKIENIWQSVMRKYLGLSDDSKLYEAARSSHYIHLTDTDLVCEILNEDISTQGESK